ncbi:MAG: arsinothricin resistance N-acetyltransferase ArsN1 family B [Dehalococcoidia bacterium]
MAVIRLATPADAAAVQGIYAPYVRDTAISFEYDPPTIDEMRRRIEHTLEAYPYLVLEDGDEVIGYAYADRFSGRRAYAWSASVSVYCRSDRVGRGAGRALYGALIPALELLGHRQLYAGIALPNGASVALHERMGFTHLGTYERVGWKLGQWHPVGWWQLLLEAPEGEPAAPVPVGRVAGTDRFEEALARGLSFLRG